MYNIFVFNNNNNNKNETFMVSKSSEIRAIVANISTRAERRRISVNTYVIGRLIDALLSFN